LPSGDLLDLRGILRRRRPCLACSLWDLLCGLRDLHLIHLLVIFVFKFGYVVVGLRGRY